jgi:hypothetical protein
MTALLDSPPLARLAILAQDVKHGPAVQVGEFVERMLSGFSGVHDVAPSFA